MFTKSWPATAIAAGILLAGCSGSSGAPANNTGNGGGTTITGPSASFSSLSVTFPTTASGSPATAIAVTLSNPGTATLVVTGFAFSGANPTAFTQTNNCTSIAAGSSCTIMVNFTPTAAGTATKYTANLIVTDNTGGAPGSTQTVTLSGTGGASSISYQLLAFPEPDNSVTPLYTFINSAQKTIEMTMYTLEDTTFTAYLVAACKRGVTVRVILDQNDEKSGNTSAFNSLNAVTNCSSV